MALRGKSTEGVHLNLKHLIPKSQTFPRNKALNKVKERSPPAGIIGPRDIFQNKIKADRPFFQMTYQVGKAEMDRY